MTITVSNFGSLDNNEQKTMLNLPVNPTPNEQKKTIELRVRWGGIFRWCHHLVGLMVGTSRRKILEQLGEKLYTGKTPTVEVKRP